MDSAKLLEVAGVTVSGGDMGPIPIRNGPLAVGILRIIHACIAATVAVAAACAVLAAHNGGGERT